MIKEFKKASLSIILSLLALCGCGGEDVSSTSSQEPTWYDSYTKDELDAFYNYPLKIGYSENFTYTSTSYEVGYGNNKTIVYPFEEMIRLQFPNATFEKITDESDTNTVINKHYDVLYGLNNYSLEKLKAEYDLEAFVPMWAKEVQEGLNDPQNMYFAIGKEAVVTLYDYKYYTQDINFEDILSLANQEEYQNRYALNYMKSGWDHVINKTLLASILSPYRSDEESAIEGISLEGWSQLEKWVSYLRKEFVNGSTVLNDADFKNGESEIKIVIDNATDAMDKLTYYRNNPKKIKARLERVQQKEIPYFIYGAAITRSTKCLEASKLFMEYVGSKEVEEEMSRNKRSFFPANDRVLTQEIAYRLDVDQASLDYKSGYETRQLLYRSKNTKCMSFDWEFINQHIDEWITKVKKMG